jgi:hypothetical protein
MPFKIKYCLKFFIQGSHLLADIFPCFHQNSITYICILENDIGKSLHVTFEWPYNKVLPRSHLSAIIVIAACTHIDTDSGEGDGRGQVCDGNWARREMNMMHTNAYSERVCVYIHPRAPHPAPLDICGHGTRSISIQQLSASQLSCVCARRPQTYQQIATAPHI